MRILVMQKGTKFFLGKRGTWVKRVKLALDFMTSTEALSHCLQKGLTEVDFLLHFENSTWDIRVPDVLGGTPKLPSARRQSGMDNSEPTT